MGQAKTYPAEYVWKMHAAQRLYDFKDELYEISLCAKYLHKRANDILLDETVDPSEQLDKVNILEDEMKAFCARLYDASENVYIPKSFRDLFTVKQPE